MLLGLPFAHMPTGFVFILASLSTFLWTIGAYLMFAAIKNEAVSRVVPTIGTLIPLILFAHAAIFSTISQTQILAVGILVLGLVFLTFSSLHLKGVKLEVLSALFFAISYLVLRESYLRENFLTVLVYSRFVLIPLCLAIFFIPKGPKPKLNLLFVAGQAAGGMQQLLLTFAISLATPALVNSIAGIQYVFLFFFSLLLSKKYPQIFAEKLSFLSILTKI